MGSLRFADIQTHPTEVLDLTSLTVEEFQHLVSPFETAFQDHMAHWRLRWASLTSRFHCSLQPEFCNLSYCPSVISLYSFRTYLEHGGNLFPRL